MKKSKVPGDYRTDSKSIGGHELGQYLYWSNVHRYVT